MVERNWPFLGLRDPVSAGTHFLALLGALFATAFLWRLCRGQRARQRALACFGLSMCLLYAASALYHTLRLPPERLWFFRCLDHCAIYVLIAGTFTPTLVLLRQPVRRRLYLAGIWALAGVGVVCKWLVPVLPEGITVALYVGMGWSGVLPGVELVRMVGWRGLAWIFWGGVSYTMGALADLVGWPILCPGICGPHEVFHVLVMGGTLCHVVFMFRHVVTGPHPVDRAVEPAATDRRA